MRIRLGDLRAVLSELAGASKHKWYHLSEKDLGDKFTFTPRWPNAPYVDDNGDIIEDDFTKRSSWAPSIQKALEALPDNGPSVVYNVYVVGRLPGDVDLADTFEDCPESPKNPYGEDFETIKWKTWAHDVGVPFKLTEPPQDAPRRARSAPKALAKCVPDAKRTGEHWATKPVIAKRVAKGTAKELLGLKR